MLLSIAHARSYNYVDWHACKHACKQAGRWPAAAYLTCTAASMHTCFIALVSCLLSFDACHAHSSASGLMVDHQIASFTAAATAIDRRHLCNHCRFTFAVFCFRSLHVESSFAWFLVPTAVEAHVTCGQLCGRTLPNVAAQIPAAELPRLGFQALCRAKPHTAHRFTPSFAQASQP